MTDLPKDLAEELQKVWTALVSDLGVPAVRFVVQPGTIRGFLQQDVFVVPESHVKHFGRFGTIPTSLVRDAAYEAKKRQLGKTQKLGSSAEADAMAYAEVFLRAAMMQGPDHG
ncbi:MAG TPA: hypothetical protein VGB18_08235 [Candidatus Thermoplasmatota archaeon]